MACFHYWGQERPFAWKFSVLLHPLGGMQWFETIEKPSKANWPSQYLKMLVRRSKMACLHYWGKEKPFTWKFSVLLRPLGGMQWFETIENPSKASWPSQYLNMLKMSNRKWHVFTTEGRKGLSPGNFRFYCTHWVGCNGLKPSKSPLKQTGLRSTWKCL